MKKTIGNQIAELRKQHGMTQLDLANQLNVSDKTISKWERDLSLPDIHVLTQLASIFQISIDELMQTDIAQTIIEKSTIDISFILKAISLALGIAIIVLMLLQELDTTSAIIMLAISISCLSFQSIK